jgi:hypothetical protein
VCLAAAAQAVHIQLAVIEGVVGCDVPQHPALYTRGAEEG